MKVDDPRHRRRTLYSRIDRRELDTMLMLYDFPIPSGHSPKRIRTITPLQQLFVLNSPFVIEQSDALATRVLAREGRDAERVDHAFQLTLGRKPTAAERDRALAYITTTSRPPPDKAPDKASARQRAWSLFCQVLLAGAEFRYLD